MFGRLIGLVVLVFLGGALASWLAAQPGMLAFEWFGWQVEMRTSLAVAILVFTAVALLFVDRLLRGLLNLPAWLGGNLPVAARIPATGHWHWDSWLCPLVNLMKHDVRQHGHSVFCQRRI